MASHLLLFFFNHPCSNPAVLCSNSWQSAGGREVGQHSSGNHVANEPGSLHPPAVNIRRLPEFDQDSWTINAPPGTEKRRGTAQTLDLHNNNSNNTLTPVQATGGHSAASQASDVDRRPADSTPPLRTAEGTGVAATSGARTRTTTAAAAASPPSERSGTSNEAATSDDMMVVTLTPNGLDEVQPNSEAREPAAINREGVQESSTSGGDVVP